MELIEIIEKAKERANIPSDYALAKAMRIERQVISQWRGGKRHPSNEEAVQLATLAGLDEMRVIAEIELRTANTEKKREFWKQWIEARGIAGTALVCFIGISIIATPEANAEVLHNKIYAFENKQNIHYARIAKKLIIQAMFIKLGFLLNQISHHAQKTARTAFTLQ
jgi:hypothetical protein